MSVAETKSPGWMRAVQIGLGIIALILSIYVLAFPVADFCRYSLDSRHSIVSGRN